jgi:hypothetical protein
VGSDPAGRVVVLCHDPHQIDGVVARLIDPALPEPHRFMPAQPREGMTGSRTPRLACADLRHTCRRNPITPYPRWSPSLAVISIASSSPASRPFVLAALRALRLDPDCG